MVVDIFKALFIVGFPVGLFSFLMFYFAYKKDYLSTETCLKDAFKNNDAQQSKLSKQQKRDLQFMHSKWVTFGGGFYGLIAVLTFVVIELNQIISFLLSVTGWQDIAALFSIQALIAMFVDSIMNMIKAAIWFTYWPSLLPESNFLLWVLVAYIGYKVGAYYARIYRLYSQQSRII